MNTRIGFALAILSCAFSVNGRAQDSAAADTIFRNGKIYTVNEKKPWAQAVAVKGGIFIKVGSNAEVAKFIGKDTKLIDLGGKFVMPGVHDTHVHPAYPYAYKLDGQLDFPATLTKPEIQAALKAHADQHPEQKWIRGKQWAHNLFPPDGKMPKEFIDAAVRDRPVVLVAESGHNVTANSRALELAGIGKDTPNPAGGVIDRDPKTGEATGYLSEEAIALVGKFIPIPGNESWYQGLAKGLEDLRRVGVTSIVDAKTGRGALMGYRRLEDEGRLNMHVQASLSKHDYAMTVIDNEDATRLIKERKNFESRLVKTNSVKIVADGTFLSFTSLLLEPYSNNPKAFGETAIDIAPSAFNDLLSYQKDAIQLHVHAHGDGTVREVLNLIEKLQQAAPRPGLRHHIAHASLIDREDLPRFKALDVGVDFSPPLFYPSVFEPMMRNIFGAERLQKKWYPIKDVIETGAIAAYATDWPLAFPNPAPWPYLEGVVTRKDPEGKVPGQMGEPITLAQGIRMLTLSGAELTMRERESGSIEEGKQADMIVLDRNLFTTPSVNIDRTQVLLTVFDGKVVYRRSTK